MPIHSPALMITGNFALIAGLIRSRGHRWYLEV